MSGALGSEAVEEELERVTQSPQFALSKRRCELLRYLVKEWQAGRSEAITEYSLGLDIFRKPKDFDPRIDPIVRVEMNRLRQRLREYYASTASSVVIEIPVRSYQPVFTSPAPREDVDAPVEPSGAGNRPARANPLIALWAGLLLLALGLIVFWRMRPGPVEPSSVAVLPFLDLSSGHEREYVADGFTDEITAALSNVPGLRVAARTSAFKFKGRADDIRTIAQMLNVDAVVEGSIFYAGDRVRITAQLNRATDGFHMWSQTFERNSGDLFRVEDEIATGIANALRPKRAKYSLAQSAVPVKAEAQNAYLKGRYFWNKRTADAVRKAAGYLEQAIQLEPEFALAHAALADCYIVLANNDQAPPGEMVSRAATEARRALTLDPARGEAHAVLAQVKLYHDWDWTGAVAEYDRAIELSPNYATAHHWKALALTWLGGFSGAAAEIARAQALDPLSPVIAGTSAVVQYYAGHYDKAAELAERALELDNANYFPHYMIGLARVRQKRYPEGLAQLREALRLSNESETMVYLANALACAGDSQGANALLAQLRNHSGGVHVSRYQMAYVYAGLAERGLALDNLEAAFSDHEPDLVMLKVEPVFAGLRTDPRFIKLIDSLRFQL